MDLKDLLSSNSVPFNHFVMSLSMGMNPLTHIIAHEYLITYRREVFTLKNLGIWV